MTLNEFVSFYSKSQVQNEYGTLTTTRVKITDAWAKVRPLSGNERNASDQTEDFANYRFYIHHRTDVIAADLIVWNGTDYNIKFIADNGPKEAYLYLDAQRGGAM